LYLVGETLNKAKWGKMIIWDYLIHLVWKNKFTLFRSIMQLHIWSIMYYKINLHSIHVRIAVAGISCTWFHWLQNSCSLTLNWWQRSYLSFFIVLYFYSFLIQGPISSLMMATYV
jgi:hypothetical protein